MVGAGYVGLVSGACFAEFGANVTCIDVDAEKIGALRESRLPIYEPGLNELVNRNVEGGRLTFSSDFEPAVPEADLVFVAVGTPSRRGDGHADLSFVYAAARDIESAALERRRWSSDLLQRLRAGSRRPISYSWR